MEKIGRARFTALFCAPFLGLVISVSVAGFTAPAAAPGGPAPPPKTDGRPPEARQVSALLSPEPNFEGLRSLGPGVLPILAAQYERGDEATRSTIAKAFYVLGWKSAEAKRVLMRDVHTQDTDLRLHVQWALGRVSNDPDVVDVLLDNMRNDDNPLFRDKAACALANDQIHLTDDQKYRLYERLVDALGDEKLDVRQIALQVLRIQTGQTKSFEPSASPQAREAAIREWKRWLATYRAQL